MGRLGRGPEALEGGTHALEQLLVAVEWDIEDARPGGDPAHLVGLGDPSAAVASRLEPVTPRRRRPSTLVGDEGELTSRIGRQHGPVTRIADASARAYRVVTNERRADHGHADVSLPFDALALGAPLSDAWEVGDQPVERRSVGLDLELDAVLGQPPPLILRCHDPLPSSAANDTGKLKYLANAVKGNFC